ncbi:MAG: nitroreductase family protein [Promethearchaeota archaeon]|jgi:nitroreductase
MTFSKPIIDIIQERKSHRTYSGNPLERDLREKVINLLETHNIRSPFSQYAGKSRFTLISIPDFDPKEKKKIGTYGIIKGAQDFIVGTVEKSQYSREHFGYILETIILAMTDIGLGTCWLGGTFNRSLFSEKINCSPNEILPAISPIGYIIQKSVREKIIRSVAKADKRLPWERLYFEGNLSVPMTKTQLGKYATVLEMIQIGPSAGNKQPWRIVKETDKNIFHFYSTNPKNGRFLKYDKFRPLDIGISVCHFNLTAEELSLKGNWVIDDPQIPNTENLLYKITWEEI